MRYALALAALLIGGCTNQAGVTCPPGQTLCGSECVFTQQDPLNCGACGNACATGTVCVAGSCGCPPGLMICGGACADVKSDVNNCGTCNTACASPEVCSMSACSDNCGTGLTNCSRDCVDLTGDDRNCGACGNACGAGEKCQSGVCTPECPTGQSLCGTTCVNANNDRQNCGACGNACPNDYFCVFGVCILGCPQPLTRCIPDGGASDGGSQCVDTRSDPDNCGGCSGANASPVPSAAPFLPHVCEVGANRHSNPVCDDGRCAATCKAGFFDCRHEFGGDSLPNFTPDGTPQPSTPSELFCFDFKDDPCNCGGCLNTAPGWFPEFDAVTGASSICIDQGTQNTGASEGLCCNSVPTFIDQGFSCGSSCADVAACPESSPACCTTGTGHACRDTGNDLNNCGECGNGQFAGGFGDCTQMPSPPPPAAPPFPACCGGGCIDLNNDVNNCGACNMACPAPQPSSMPACCPGSSPGPGAPSSFCADLAFDSHNCNACGRDCTTVCGSASPCFNGGCQCP